MNVSKPVLSSIVLLAVSAGMWIPLVLNVNVTNFPLDEQGNLKVTSAIASKVVTVVKDLNVSWTVDQKNMSYFTVEVEGYNEFIIYVGLRNWTAAFDCSAAVSFIADGIEDYYVYPEDDSIRFQAMGPYSGYVMGDSALYHIRGPVAKIRVEVERNYYYPESGWILVSISLYLRS